MCISRTAIAHRRQSGFTLVETIMFIVIVSVGVAGLASVMSVSVRHSADPMIRKQAIAVAESLMEEILLQPFTDCDPDAFNAITQACTTIEALGPETIAGETRIGVANPFDNVNDYHGFKMASGIQSITDGAVIAGLGGYAAEVVITQVGDKFALAAAEALKITVKVTEPGVEMSDADDKKVILTGYRFKYAPTP